MIGKHVKSERLRRCNRFILCGAVRHHAWKIQHLGNPAPVGLKFRLHLIHNM